MERLKTADDMLNYCLAENTDAGTLFNWDAKHFAVVADELKPDEYAFTAFTGRINGYNWAFVITKERIVAGQKKVIGQAVKSVYLQQINDISSRTAALNAIVEIDTIKERFTFSVDRKNAKSVTENIHRAIDEAKRPAPQPASAPSNGLDAADQLLKFKALLDAGAITQEEYDAKKKQLLNL